MTTTPKPAKPFLKWAGGKTQLLSQFAAYYPAQLGDGGVTKYFEPFLGSGAVFLDILQKYPIREVHLGDINEELILVYRVVQKNPEELLAQLADLKRAYLGLSEAGRKLLFYEVREEYNRDRHKINRRYSKKAWIPRAAQMIFLNKTCFNGLFRLNRSGAFNVPFGRYREPRIVDPDNLRAVSRLLQKAEIRHGHFDVFSRDIDARSFVYFDPPYRPLSKTASFTAYSRHAFGDAEQTALAAYFARLDREHGAKLMLSNSACGEEDDFLRTLYRDYRIGQVYAGRMINSNAGKRGKIPELLITNYAKPGELP